MTTTSRLRSLIGGRGRIGLGGEGILRTEGRDQEAQDMLVAAYESGIRYYDSARAYAGSERYLGQFWDGYPSWRNECFQASKSAERDAAGAARDLVRTLSSLSRGQLGLWQVHDLEDANDIRQLEGSHGGLRAFYDARERGVVKGIGVTGHYDPAVLLHAVSEWDIDSVLLPVSPVETVLGGFSDLVIPAARERGIGVIGMKVLGRGYYLSPESGLSHERLIRYALSQDVDLVIAGCATPEESRALARIGKDFQPMDEDDQAAMVEAVRPHADRLAFYRGVL